MSKKYIIIILFILILLRNDETIFSKYYDHITVIDNPAEIDVLVNKMYKLNSDYVPKNLSKIDTKYAYDDKYLIEEAKNSFEQLSKDAKINGYNIIVVSAYRDYNYQDKLYQKYVNEKGIVYADKCSARPGHSEHQTGLSIDVMGSNNDYNIFDKSKEFKWMKDNAHKYGFIMRYPKNKEYITGFKYEPWHYRYVGINTAKKIYKNNITLEEYKRRN